MSQCNFCSLRDIERWAKKEGKKVTVCSDTEWGMGGVNVYVHPKEISIKNLSGGEDGERMKYRKSWFMELPEQCCC